MSRDVVLDIIFTKMIGREYLAGVDCEVLAREEEAKVVRALITKGLVREYAGALRRGDTATMSRATRAMDTVSKAIGSELFNFVSGPREVKVNRDERGRFSRTLTGETSAYAPEPAARGKRAPKQVAADPELAGEISNQLRGNDRAGNAPADPNASRSNRQRGQQRAGQVRAISRLQDELLDLFGDEAGDDVVVVVETVPTSPDEEPVSRRLGLKDPVTAQSVNNPNGVLPIDEDVPLKATYEMKGTASPELREKFNTFNGLIDIGMRPETASAYARGEGASTPGAQAATVYQNYTGRKPSSNKARAERHFNTASTLGNYLSDTSIPQLQGVGRALQATGKIGGQIPEDAYKVAERANYRYRGMKDNLPKTMSEALKAGEHQMLTAAFSDPALTKERWKSQLVSVSDYLQEMETRNKDAFNAQVYRPVLAATIASTPAGVSPRDFIDRYTRDLSVMSLIPEIPADQRAVKLGEAAGFGVPSSGMIIRPDGAFKELYRGVGPDHYLPFSAKALPELRDGQYVRTRYRGGLTNEDVSVLVASGARKATVVSSSGLFTIELKPDTSAEGRMRSPEVAAMGERYERILDQVATSGIYMKDLDPAVKEKLHAQATQFTGKPQGDAGHKARYDLLEAKERATQSKLTEQEIDKITSDVITRAQTGQLSDEDAGRTTEMLVKEALSDARKEKVRAISLNGEGYAMALETLRLQYPSIIRRVGYEPLKDFVNDRGLKGAIDPATIALRNRPGGVDTTLAKPGQTNPHTKRWSAEKDAATAAAEAKIAATAGAGATAGGAAGTTIASGESAGGKPMLGGEAFRNLYSERKRQLDAALIDAKKTHQKAFAVNQAHAMSTEFDAAKKDPAAFVRGALDEPDLLNGPDAALNTANNPGWLAFMGPSAWAKAAEDKQGLTLGMTLAYDKTLDNTTLWEPGAAVEGEDARLGIDDVMSTSLISSSSGVGVVDKPMPTTGQYAFYVPPDVAALIPREGDINAGEVLTAVDSVMTDTASAEGKARSDAKAYLDNLVKTSEASLAHDKDVDGIQDLSVLGLLALQTRIMGKLELTKFKAQSPNPDDVALLEGLTGGEEGPFFSQEAFDTAKQSATAGLQGVIGAEFVRRVLGGGDAGPKGLTRVAKADRPVLEMLQSFLRSRPVEKSHRPQLHLRSHPESRLRLR